MQTVPPALTACPACGTATEGNGACPRCQAADLWADQVQAVDFVLRRLEDWHKGGSITTRQYQTLSDIYNRRRDAMVAASQSGQAFRPEPNLPARDVCWSCKEPAPADLASCDHCGAPINVPAAKSLRYYRYLFRELEDHEQNSLLTLRQAHELIGEAKDRITALKGKLERDRVYTIHPIEPDEPRPRSIARSASAGPPRRSFVEVLLDPQSIQWLLATGGGLLVLGLVIWLSSLGLFDNPGVVAAALGLGNAALVAGGWAMIRFTRYQFAGRALTLLACLVMPLNLWFYHAHGLITLQGHLWVAALVCCVVYAASAFVLRDPLFVYVLVGGIALTGLLMLGDVQHLDEILAPSALLVALALVSLHAERAFPDAGETPFSRRRFGMAFYWSAQVLLAAGLLLLLGAQMVGWMHAPLFRHLGFARPAVVEQASLPWTLLLTLAGTYALVYSDVVVRRIGVYLYLAALTLLWAEVQLLVLLNLTGSESIVIATFALTALAVNVLQSTFADRHAYLRTVPPLGLLLSLMPVLFGTLLLFRATNRVLFELWPYTIGWDLIGAMALVALACRAGAYLYRRSFPELSVTYFFLTAAATLVFAAALAPRLGLLHWQQQAPVLMLIPIAYVVASRLYRGHTPEHPLVWVAHASTGVMIACSIWTALEITPEVVGPVTGRTLNVLLALFCLEAAVFYGLAAALRKQGWNVYLATAMLCGAIWQTLIYFHTPDEYYTVAFSLLGVGLLVLYRFGIVEQWEWGGLSRAAFQSANALTTLGFVSGALLSLSRLVLSEAELSRMDPAGDWRGPVRVMIYLLIFLTVVSLVAAWLVQQREWRRVYLVLTVVNVVLVVLMFHKMSLLSPWQKLEFFSVILGLVLLVVGHVGWYREDEERANDLVSFSLVGGSIALALPLAIATVVHRFGFRISAIDELGLVAASVALLGSGILCRIRSTTIVGGTALVAYVLMVIIYMHRFLEQQILVGIYLTIGGGLLFGTGLVLSIYRDRLLALPDKIKRREGVFRVIGWR
jgi:hypothetical protein